MAGEVLHFLFSTWWLVAFALTWVAVSMFGSLLSNHQNRRNKVLNTLKILTLATFLVSWTLLAGWASNGKITPAGAIIGYTGAALVILGDWLAFFLNRIVRSPGGVRGAFWKWLLDRTDAFRLRVLEEARQSLTPAERQFMEMEKAERERVVVSAPGPMIVSVQSAPSAAEVMPDPKGAE